MAENEEPSSVSYTEPPDSGNTEQTRPQVAVAIKGDGRRPFAPAHIVAAGRGEVAARILDLAFSRGVRVREDADLAEILAKLELDTPIPSEAIVAVAEILARVYAANAAALRGANRRH